MSRPYIVEPTPGDRRRDFANGTHTVAVLRVNGERRRIVELIDSGSPFAATAGSHRHPDHFIIAPKNRRFLGEGQPYARYGVTFADIWENAKVRTVSDTEPQGELK
jgi:hypothetical protein